MGDASNPARAGQEDAVDPLQAQLERVRKEQERHRTQLAEEDAQVRELSARVSRLMRNVAGLAVFGISLGFSIAAGERSDGFSDIVQAAWKGGIAWCLFWIIGLAVGDVLSQFVLFGGRSGRRE